MASKYPQARPYKGGSVITPGTGRTPAGIVRADGKKMADDNGSFFPLGMSFFPGFWLYKNDLDRCRRWFQYGADHQVNYTRNFARVYGVSWEDRVINPLDADFPDLAKRYLDEAFTSYLLRTQITIFATPDDQADRIVDVILGVIRGREQAIQYIEPVNEGNFDDWNKVRGFVSKIRAAFPGLVAYRTPDTFSNDTFGFDIANLGMPHLERQAGDEDWRQARQGCEVMGLSKTCDNNEPVGPQSSVAMLSDPLRLATLRAVGIVSGMPGFCLHTGAGVRAGGAADLATGKFYLPRKSNIWEYGDEVENIFTALQNGVRFIPQDAPNWRPVKGHWADTRLFADMIWSDNPSGFDHGCVRVYGSYTDNQYVEIVFGIRRFVNLTQKFGAYDVKVYDLGTGDVMLDRHVNGEETFRVEGDPTGGSNKAVVVVGTR